MKYRFYKNEIGWFIDIKWWPKKYIHHLAMVAGADVMLDILSEGNDEITLEISSKKVLLNDYQGYSFGLSRRGVVSLFGGAIYEPMHESQKISNPMFGNKNLLWLCFVTLVVFGKYPRNIYFKIIENEK